MIRLLLEDVRQKEPDQAFIAMMHEFVANANYGNVSTADFQKIVEKYMREPMDWFFNEWVYGTEIPEYDFKYTLNPGEGGKTVLKMTLTQAGVSDQFVMRVPIYATVGKVTRRLGFINVKGSTTSQGEVALGFHPDKITIDDRHDILCFEHQ
jgi:aminopeptidase N